MENRRLSITLKVMGVRMFLFFRNGAERERITGSVTKEAVRAGAEGLLS